MVVRDQKGKYLATDSVPITRVWILRFKSIVCIPHDYILVHFLLFKLSPKGIPLATSNAV